MPDNENPAQNAAPLSLASPVDVARATAGLVLQEAVNLGEINPATARRFGERMDQIFTSLIRGAGVQWGPQGDLLIKWPEIENPMLAAAKEKARIRALESSTAIPLPLDESGQPALDETHG